MTASRTSLLSFGHRICPCSPPSAPSACDASTWSTRPRPHSTFAAFSHDPSGAGREQTIDRNWKVCDQNVPAGAQITPDTAIDFGAVKLAEDC